MLEGKKIRVHLPVNSNDHSDGLSTKANRRCTYLPLIEGLGKIAERDGEGGILGKEDE